MTIHNYIITITFRYFLFSIADYELHKFFCFEKTEMKKWGLV